MSENSLFVTTIENSSAKECSGCGNIFEPKEKFISGIESCCGQCYRDLCISCVKMALKMVTDSQ